MAKMVTVNEAAKIKGCSRQAIHAAIASNRVEAKAEKVTRIIWKVNARSLAKLVINPKMKRNGRPPRHATRQYCGRCGASTTETDKAAGFCTQCKAVIK